MHFELSINELESKVRDWSRDRKILEHSTSLAQFVKAVSEMGELADALAKHRHNEIRDAIGDVLVCLINVAALEGLNLQECLVAAWEEIKDRRGTLTASGVFVKEGDVETP